MHEVKGSSVAAVKAGWIIAGVLGVGGVLLGVLGWRAELPSQYGASEVAYRTWGLFLLEFMDEGIALPIGTVLNVARFVAPAATFFVLFSVLADVMLRTWTRCQAKRRSRHDVVVGDGVGVVRLAVNLRRFTAPALAATGGRQPKPRKVTLVSSPAIESDDELRQNKIQVVTGASDAVRDAVVANANRVFIDYATDAESARVAVSLAAKHPGLDVVTILNEAELAEHWAADERLPGHVVSQIATVAVEATRRHPPMLDDKACPPPIVVGDGAMAAELVRRIMTGWQQVGDHKLVHCIGAELAWTADAAVGLEHIGEVREHQVCQRSEAVVRAVGEVVAQWRVPEEREAQVAGPTIYVALASDSRVGLVATRLSKALPSTRVIAVMEGDPGAWSTPARNDDNLSIISGLETMTSPEALMRTKEELFREELAKDAACWADETLDLFRGVRHEDHPDGPLQRSMDAVIDAVVANVANLFAAGGVRLDAPSPASAAALLNPWQLEAIAASLTQLLDQERPTSTALHVGFWANDKSEAAIRERWFWAVEVAARLPSLAARAGWSPTLMEGTEPSLLRQADIEQMAEWIHETYRVTHHTTQGATGSTAAQWPWDQLPDFLKSSNRASAAAASQRLATLRLSWRRSGNPATFSFTDDQVALLAEAEHRRWSHFHRRSGYEDHVMLKPWGGLGGLTEAERSFDRDPVLAFARQLGRLGIEIYDPSSGAALHPHQEQEAVPKDAAPTTQPTMAEAPSGNLQRWYPVTRCGTVTARRLEEPHEWTTEAGDVMQGNRGDWLVNDAWTVIDEEFQATHVHVAGDTFERAGAFFARPARAPEVVDTLEGTATASDGDMVLVRQAAKPWVVPIEHFREMYTTGDGASPLVAVFNPEGPVFVSYRRDGGMELADEITALLRAGGIVPWRDMADLTPGLTEDEVGFVMRTGLSAMVLAASPGIEHSDFVPRVEMPPVLRRIELDGTARPDPFKGGRLEFVVANATPLPPAGSGEQAAQGMPDYACLDGQFRTKMGDEFQDTCLANFKHYSFLEPQNPMLNSRRDLLRDLLRARIAVRKPGSFAGRSSLVVATQTRPEQSTFNRQDVDLTMSLTGMLYDHVPSASSYASLQQALPVTVDVLFDAMASTSDHGWEKLRFVGGGHLSLYWALGAALPTSRKGLTIGVDVPSPIPKEESLYWEDQEDEDATRYRIKHVKPGEPRTHERHGRPGVAIHIGTTPAPRLALFKRMVPNIPNCVSEHALQVEYPQVPNSENEPRFSRKLDPESGSAIADDIAHLIKDIVRDEEQRLPNSPDVMLHINFAGPTSLALFIARRLSTYQVVFYEQDRLNFEEAQELLPVFVVEPGTYGGPITHVFSDEDRAAFRRGQDFINPPRDRTPHQG